MMKFTRPEDRFSQDEHGQWWYQQPGHSRKRTSPRTCPWCKELYISPDHRQCFCSHSCAAASKHAGRPSTTPRSPRAGADLGNSDNKRFTRDDSGQWWYVAGPSSGRTRAHIRICKQCGKQFLGSIFHKSQHCSRSCGLKTFNAKNPGRWKGERGSNWKGGRQISRGGYVLVLATDHPSPKKVGGRYMFEHRLVMEKMLGRFLLPSEQVHHKNGKRDDNRPENLELWVKKQPPGQRVEDLVAFAREIIKTYEPILRKLKRRK